MIIPTRVGLTLEVARCLAWALHVGLDALAGTFDEDTDAPQAEALPPEPPVLAVPRRGRPRKIAPDSIAGEAPEAQRRAVHRRKDRPCRTGRT